MLLESAGDSRDCLLARCGGCVRSPLRRESISKVKLDQAKLAEQEKRAGSAAARKGKPQLSEHDFSLDEHLRGDTQQLNASQLEYRGRRLAGQANDFRALSYSVFGARIFFRTDDEDLERAMRATERLRASAPRPTGAAAAAASGAADGAAAV